MDIINSVKKNMHRDALLSLFDCEDDTKKFEDAAVSHESLKNGIDYGIINDVGDTIFHHLIRTNQNSLLKHLVNQIGSERLLLELQYRDDQRNTLVMVAVQMKNWEALEILFDGQENSALFEELNEVCVMFALKIT